MKIMDEDLKLGLQFEGYPFTRDGIIVGIATIALLFHERK